jgi:pSer/pThr/pTyr-binding forkhead associated (FHA) protein
VGRDSSADVQIHDTGLSRKHFEIIWDGKKAGIRDLGSTNGTFVGGVKISEQALAVDSIIKAGNKSFVFKLVARAVNN